MDSEPAGPTLDAVMQRVNGLDARVVELEGRVRDLETAGSEFRRALNRLGDALSATHDLPAMLSAVLETSALYLRARAAVFYAAVAGSDRLRALTFFGGPDLVDVLPELETGEGLAGAAARFEKVLRWPSEEVPGLAADEPPATIGAVAVPIRSGTRLFGVLALYGRWIDAPFSDDDIEMLATLVRQVESAIENVFLYEEASRLSITDGLTSLWNRRHFDLQLVAEIQRAVRFGHPFSVLILDLDQMKEINDLHGHQAGDAVLIEVAQRLTGGVRNVDLVARFGGDEFALILPNTGVAGALRLADKVRSAVADDPFELEKGEAARLTISVGVASYPEHGDTERALIQAADVALYRAKAAGGNRVEHAKVEP